MMVSAAGFLPRLGTAFPRKELSADPVRPLESLVPRDCLLLEGLLNLARRSCQVLYM